MSYHETIDYCYSMMYHDVIIHQARSHQLPSCLCDFRLLAYSYISLLGAFKYLAASLAAAEAGTFMSIKSSTKP